MHHNNIEGAKSKGAEKASKYLWEKTCECCREKHREKLWKKHTTMKCNRKLILVLFFNQLLKNQLLSMTKDCITR